MRFNIKKLEQRGFTVYVDKESIDIHSPPMDQATYDGINAVVKEKAGIKDPALQDFVMSGFLIAMQRAQILELCE